MAENRCYDADCADENCRNPEHYNYICFDPKCDEIHCTDSNHYDKQLLREYQENSDLSIYDHRGCDIVFATKEKMREFYNKLKPYFLEYDAEEMSRRFND